MEYESREIDDWEGLVNKPVFASDGKQVGIASEIQPEKIIVSFGPITADKYAIPKTSVIDFRDGVVYLKETGDAVEDDYKYSS